MIEVIVRDGWLAEIELKIPPRVVSSSPLSSGTNRTRSVI
jgi:hypothetical protein